LQLLVITQETLDGSPPAGQELVSGSRGFRVWRRRRQGKNGQSTRREVEKKRRKERKKEKERERKKERKKKRKKKNQRRERKKEKEREKKKERKRKEGRWSDLAGAGV